MDDDDQSAALQHQAELEQWQVMLSADSAYEQWLEQVEKDYAIQ